MIVVAVIAVSIEDRRDPLGSALNATSKTGGSGDWQRRSLQSSACWVESAHPPPASWSPNTSLIESPGHRLEHVSVDDPDSLVARNDKAEVLAHVCARLAAGDTTNARETLRSGYPFAPQAKVARRYTERQCLRVFYRDGFIDRYSGTRLVNPGVLRHFR